MPEHENPCAHKWSTNDGLFCYDCGIKLDPQGRPELEPKRKRWRVEDKRVDEPDAPREQCDNHWSTCMKPGCDHDKYPSELDKKYPRPLRGSKTDRWNVENK